MTLRQLFGLIFLVAFYLKLFSLCWYLMEPPTLSWKGLDQVLLSCIIYAVVGFYTLIIEAIIVSFPLLWWQQWSLIQKYKRDTK